MFQQFNLIIYVIIVSITEYLTQLRWTSNLPTSSGGGGGDNGGDGCGFVRGDLWTLNGHSKLAELHLSLKIECWIVTVVRYPASAREGNNVLLIFCNMKLYVWTIQSLKW